MKKLQGISLVDTLRINLNPRMRKISIRLEHKPFIISDTYWFQHCYQDIIIDEIYRFPIHSKLQTIVDCGSNIGLSALYFKKLNRDCVLTCFEPDPYLFTVLSTNLAQHNFNNIKLEPFAVWTEETSLTFASDKSVGGHLDFSNEKNSNISVKTKRLKDYLQMPVDLLKIDIEGAEMPVLRDCHDELRNVSNLFVEYHRRSNGEDDLPDLLDLLASRGFTTYIKEASSCKHPFMQETKALLYDYQANIFAYRS